MVQNSTDSTNLRNSTDSTSANEMGLSFQEFVKIRKSVLQVQGKDYFYFPVQSFPQAASLPYSHLVLLENVMRKSATDEEAYKLACTIINVSLGKTETQEIPYSPARVLLQDFTGVPVFVDFAIMREAMKAIGKDPSRVNPQIPCDLVIDHSIIADKSGSAQAIQENMKLEFERNSERYGFLKWAQRSFENVRIVPPGKGICHQINVEQFSQAVVNRNDELFFDTVVGTDSHTTTANGIGVLSWGVGGIEAEAASLGQPITTLIPKVLGVKLTGNLSEEVSAMDLALVFANKLRSYGVVSYFVECFGPGVAALSATQRACIANMTPEYGCTCTLFALDNQTLDYLRLTGKSDQQINITQAYARAQGFWYEDQTQEKTYADVIEINLSDVVPSLAGPSRPHDLIEADDIHNSFMNTCVARGLSLSEKTTISIEDETCEVAHGTLAICAVTSCTTATDPAMMLAAGLLAKNAVEANLDSKHWVKKVLAPGSQATFDILKAAGLTNYLEKLGFYNCGFGCMSCIGNSGPIAPELSALASTYELASVLSGNRNFEGRISPDVSQNYLASPATVVAYSLVGTMDFDFTTSPIGKDFQGKDVYLHDIWPTSNQIEEALKTYVSAEVFKKFSGDITSGDVNWNNISVSASSQFEWEEDSTYVRAAPYFEGMKKDAGAVLAITNARVLAILGDFITTDHISPAGAIAMDSPAAIYLKRNGVSPEMFNTYGSRRGNHEVMMRGTFANIKLLNEMACGKRGGYTQNVLTGQIQSIYDVAMSYKEADLSSVVLAGKMYGSGSSRDWAAKGPALLGVRAVIAQSFERIHRSNLIGMGILPLEFMPGESAATLGLDGSENISIENVDYSTGLPKNKDVSVIATKKNGEQIIFNTTSRIDTATEGFYYANGGILNFVLRGL